MVLLSFSVKEDELKAGTKIRTTRLYTPEKWAQWYRTQDGGDLMLNGWWKPRTKGGYKLFDRHGAGLFRIRFVTDAYGLLWPYWEPSQLSGLFVPMSIENALLWARVEGFQNDLLRLTRFFKDHYAPLDGVVFQSIAFPPVKGVE